MAKLLLSGDESLTDGALKERAWLRPWLADNWALIFSHPGDFVRCELELDRWLSVTQQTFADCRIKPLELPSASSPAAHRSWVSEVSGDAREVQLLDPRETRATVHDLSAHALREEIVALGRRRFVMIVDEALRSRRTLPYSALAEIPSPLDFAGWAAAAHKRDSAPAGLARRCAAI
jgi:alkyl hydroperoxide reductase subunit AhpC